MRTSPWLVVVAATVVAGCDDDLGPRDWDATPDTVLLWSLERPDLLGFPSGFDFIGSQRIIVESPAASGRWDLVVTEEDGTLAFTPPGWFPNLAEGPAVAEITDQAFDELERVPSDIELRTDVRMPLEVGGVYVLRTRTEICDIRGFTAGPRYARIHVLDIDVDAGTVTFEYVDNPICNNRSLVPPE